MPTEDNEDTIRRIFKEIWQDRNFDVIEELVGEDFVMHDAADEQITGRAAYRAMVEGSANIIDGQMEIQQLLSVGEYVVVRWRETGTHVGTMGKVEPTNEPVAITGIEIARFEDGMLAETWDEVNMIPLLISSGVIPEDLLRPEMPADD